MERVSDSPIRTPRFGCEHLRRIGVHPGTQVLVGRYHGDSQVFTYERDLFSRTIDGATHYLSQSTFVMGNLLIQVSPIRGEAAHPSSATTRRIVSSHSFRTRDETVSWPPELSIDDADYDLVRHGPTPTPTPRDLDPGPPAPTRDEFDRRDFGDASVDFFAGDADEGPRALRAGRIG